MRCYECKWYRETSSHLKRGICTNPKMGKRIGVDADYSCVFGIVSQLTEIYLW